MKKMLVSVMLITTLTFPLLGSRRKKKDPDCPKLIKDLCCSLFIGISRGRAEAEQRRKQYEIQKRMDEEAKRKRKNEKQKTE